MEAGQQAGFPLTDDFNGNQQEGFPVTNAGTVLERPNLSTLTNVTVDRVIFHERRATTVEMLVKGQRQTAGRKEIILSAER